MDEPVADDDGDLLIAVETLAGVHDRFDAHRSDPTGTSAGDDGDNRDGLNHPEG